MKKYHHNPTFGVRSGSKRWTPYVEARNSHELPVMRYDSPRRVATAAKKMVVCVVANLESEKVVGVRVVEWRWRR